VYRTAPHKHPPSWISSISGLLADVGGNTRAESRSKEDDSCGSHQSEPLARTDWLNYIITRTGSYGRFWLAVDLADQDNSGRFADFRQATTTAAKDGCGSEVAVGRPRVDLIA